jgi:hypothetical protein
LLTNRRYSAAYYLAAYAVECALKACIARQIKASEFPPGARFSRDVFTHDLKDLVKYADLTYWLAERFTSAPGFKRNWQIVTRWTEENRYRVVSREEAVALLSAITQEADGVMVWIRQHW